MNATATAPARQRKPRVKPARKIKLALPPRDGGPGVVDITVGKSYASYFLTPLPADFGLGFQLEKFTTQGGEKYHVLLSADGRHSCECKGFLRHGHCKHVDGLLALQTAGRLPAAPQTAQEPASEAKPADDAEPGPNGQHAAAGFLCDTCADRGYVPTAAGLEPCPACQPVYEPTFRSLGDMYRNAPELCDGGEEDLDRMALEAGY